jgi:hypothetical protein
LFHRTRKIVARKWLGDQVALASLTAVAFFAGWIYIAATMPLEKGPFHIVVGTVQSSSVVWSSKMHWGSVAEEKVILPGGRIIRISSDSGILLAAGTPIAIRVYDTGALAADRDL